MSWTPMQAGRLNLLLSTWMGVHQVIKMLQVEGGLIRNKYGHQVQYFPIKIGTSTTTNNIVELWAIRYQIWIKLGMGQGYKILSKRTSKLVINWLTIHNIWALDISILDCDYRNLLTHDQTIHPCHVYCEANRCANRLAKRAERTIKQNGRI